MILVVFKHSRVPTRSADMTRAPAPAIYKRRRSQAAILLHSTFQNIATSNFTPATLKYCQRGNFSKVSNTAISLLWCGSSNFALLVAL